MRLRALAKRSIGTYKADRVDGLEGREHVERAKLLFPHPERMSRGIYPSMRRSMSFLSLLLIVYLTQMRHASPLISSRAEEQVLELLPTGLLLGPRALERCLQ